MAGSFSRRGRRAAVAVASSGAAVIGATAFLARDDILWWWRMRGVTEIKVVFHSNHERAANFTLGHRKRD